MAERSENSDFGRVVLPHLADAMTIATWLTGNRADAEDVVQEACLRALKAMSTYAGGSPRAWTLTICAIVPLLGSGRIAVTIWFLSIIWTQKT